MTAPTEHPRWCDRKTCERRRAHCSPVKPVDTNREEASVIDVALVQEWRPAAEPQLSMTVIDGTHAEHLLMSLGQARVLSYQLRQLLSDAAGGGAR